MIYTILNEEQLLAILITKHDFELGTHFVTPHEFSQQLAYMKHPAGKTIHPHRHNLIDREIHYTQEVLFIRKGKLRVDFYDDAERYLESRILEAGDTILLASGGHGFEVLEEVEMMEVKQGPYANERDKTLFPGIFKDQAIVRESS